MSLRTLAPLAALTLATYTSAYQIPAGLQHFYDGVKNGGCQSFLGGVNDQDDGHDNKGWGFCNDTPNILYLSGPGSLGDMDTDCDGSQPCAGDGSGQTQTTFDDLLSSKYGLSSMPASDIPYVVLGTDSVKVDAPGGPIQPLSVIAVICNGQLQYAVFGDTNGEHSTGEASIGLGRICFPNEGISGDNGHGDHDVLYVAFEGEDAVVTPEEAPWTGGDIHAFMDAIKVRGDKLVAKNFGGSSDGEHNNPHTIPSSSTTGQVHTEPTASPCSNTCSWADHCFGASCGSDDDCSDSLTCQSGKCAC